MAIITLKCVNCSDNMHVDDSKQKAFCASCGAENLITQDIININNTYNQTTNIGTQHVTQKITAKLGKDVEELLTEGDQLFKMKQFQLAYEKFQKAIKTATTNWYAWVGFAKTQSALVLKGVIDEGSKIKYNKRAYLTAYQCLISERTITEAEKLKRLKTLRSTWLKSGEWTALTSFVKKFMYEWEGHIACADICLYSDSENGQNSLFGAECYSTPFSEYQAALKAAYCCAVFANDEKGKDEVAKHLAHNYGHLHSALKEVKKFVKNVNKLAKKNKLDAVKDLIHIGYAYASDEEYDDGYDDEEE